MILPLCDTAVSVFVCVCVCVCDHTVHPVCNKPAADWYLIFLVDKLVRLVLPRFSSLRRPRVKGQGCPNVFSLNMKIISTRWSEGHECRSACCAQIWKAVCVHDEHDLLDCWSSVWSSEPAEPIWNLQAELRAEGGTSLLVSSIFISSQRKKHREFNWWYETSAGTNGFYSVRYQHGRVTVSTSCSRKFCCGTISQGLINQYVFAFVSFTCLSSAHFWTRTCRQLVCELTIWK